METGCCDCWELVADRWELVADCWELVDDRWKLFAVTVGNWSLCLGIAMATEAGDWSL